MCSWVKCHGGTPLKDERAGMKDGSSWGLGTSGRGGYMERVKEGSMVDELAILV
jgi:hypothetical protein